MSFYARAAGSACQFQQVLLDCVPYTIIRAEYHPARKPGLSSAGFMVEAGWYGERWELTVHLVLRELSHAANQLLREQGFPTLSLWIPGAERVSRGASTQWLDLEFNPSEESLIASAGSQYNSSRV